jgi:hypothetical protein
LLFPSSQREQVLKRLTESFVVFLFLGRFWHIARQAGRLHLVFHSLASSLSFSSFFLLPLLSFSILYLHFSRLKISSISVENSLCRIFPLARLLSPLRTPFGRSHYRSLFRENSHRFSFFFVFFVCEMILFSAA